MPSSAARVIRLADFVGPLGGGKGAGSGSCDAEGVGDRSTTGNSWGDGTMAADVDGSSTAVGPDMSGPKI